MKNWFKTNTDSSPKDKKWWKPNISWLKLDKWVKRLDIYIIKKFLGTYFFAIALIISIAVVFDVNENIDRFINNKAPLKAIVFDYYMNFIPYFSNLFSPLFVFIAVIFFTSKLAENSEIIAMFSTGMSFKRMMRPYMISAAIISVVTFGLGAYVIPKGNVTRLDFEDRYKKKKKQEYVRNVQLEVDSGVIAYIERYENYNKTGYRFSLDKFDDKKLVAHLTARSVTYDTASVHKWTIKNYMIREMEGMREKITRGDRLDTIIKMEPQDFLIMKGQQQTMTSPELKEYIDKQKRRGFANIKEFEIEYYQRIAMSFAAFILTTIGVSLSSRKMKGGMGLHLGVGLALSFSYILFQTVSATFAVNGNTPPIIAFLTPILAVLRLHRNKAQFFTNNNIGRTVIYKYCFSRIQFTIFDHIVKDARIRLGGTGFVGSINLVNISVQWLSRRSKCIAPRPSHHIRIGVAQYIYLVLLTKLIQVIQFILRHVRNKSFPPIFHVLISQFFPADFTQLTAKSLSIYVSIFYFLKNPLLVVFP